MRTKRYRVTLTPEERTDLQQLISSGKAPARKLAHARILLKADTPAGEHGAFDDDIATAVEVSVATVERVRRRFVEEGLDVALVPKPSTAAHVTKLDGRGEARLLATMASAPPDGERRWTLRLLAAHLVELSVVDCISRETVRRVLKKVS
jgi:transposase